MQTKQHRELALYKRTTEAHNKLMAANIQKHPVQRQLHFLPSCEFSLRQLDYKDKKVWLVCGR